MRVISGICRGMKLIAPAGKATRPTSDRVKEALFNIISSRFSFDGASILDICSGTGALGIEALSRGAASSVFIENDRNTLASLEKNISDPRIKNRSEIAAMDAVKALSLLARRGKKYDVVFFDPPYNSDLYLHLIEALGILDILNSNAIFVVECSTHKPLPGAFGSLVRFDSRIYGNTVLDFFTLEGA